MRTNIEIDDELMESAMKAGPYKTKKEAVEAGLKLLARRTAYREILKWKGKLHWEGDESIDWTVPAPASPPEHAPEHAPGATAQPLTVAEPAPRYSVRRTASPAISPIKTAPIKIAPTRPVGKPRAGR